jgi:nucleotide-binding universal stress UspA family protein
VTSYRNILVAVGPLAERSAAVQHATALALRDGARLTVLSATGSPSAFIWFVPGLPENPQRALQHACQQRLQSLADSMPPGVSVTTRLHRGSPVSALSDELRHGTYDLVVIGSHERRRWRWRRGLSWALLRCSPVSILIVTPDHANVARVAPRTDDLLRKGA